MNVHIYEYAAIFFVLLYNYTDLTTFPELIQFWYEIYVKLASINIMAKLMIQITFP